MPRGTKMIILTGIPSWKSLRWTESELCAPLQEAFKSQHTVDYSSEEAKTSNTLPAWRVLSLKPEHIPTGLTQENQAFSCHCPRLEMPQKPSLSFLDLQSLTSQGSGTNTASEDELPQFLEQSFALHEGITGSQPQQIRDRSSQQASSTATESFTTTNSSTSTSQMSAPSPRLEFDVGKITALGNIPTASHIVSLRPHKMMRSLIVTVLSIPPMRPCKNRWGRYSRPADRLELIVADDTRSGFGVTLWLPPDVIHQTSNDNVQSDHETAVSAWPSSFNRNARSLRLRDVILLRNVALTEYRGKVYANSREGSTKIELLFRHGEDRSDRKKLAREGGLYCLRDLERAHRRGGADHVLEKTSRVWNWLVDFVGVAVDSGLFSTSEKRMRNMVGENKWNEKRRKVDLPPDTQ